MQKHIYPLGKLAKARLTVFISPRIIRLLLNFGADINTANKLGKTALMLAANKGFIEIVDILVKKGVDVDAQVSKSAFLYHFIHSRI